MAHIPDPGTSSSCASLKDIRTELVSTIDKIQDRREFLYWTFEQRVEWTNRSKYCKETTREVALGLIISASNNDGGS